MNFSDMRKSLRDNLLKVMADVEETFVHPEEMAELTDQFPYAVMVFGEAELEGRRAQQPVSVICFVLGDKTTIPDQLDDLQRSVYNALYNMDPKIVLQTVDMTNMFKPFGLDAGVFPPYGGIRFEGIVPYTIDRE